MYLHGPLCRHQQGSGQTYSASLMSRPGRRRLSRRCALSDQWWKRGGAASYRQPCLTIYLYIISSGEILRLLAVMKGCADPWRAPRRYENLVQVRCLLEGVGEDDILQHWHTILPDSMQRWNLDRQEVRRSAPGVKQRH